MSTTTERRLRLTRPHVAALLDAGLIEEARYELCDGELLEKMPQKKSHATACRRTTHLLGDQFGRDRVGSQAPIVLDELNEPEPDVFVTRLAVEDYPDNLSASEVVLVVEVSDATLRTDRTEKAERYAAAGIPEYWIVAVNERQVIVHRQPSLGIYGLVQTLGESDTVVPLAAPSLPLSVRDLLP